MKTFLRVVLAVLAGAVLCGCAYNAKERELDNWISLHVQKVKPVEKAAHLASWEAAVTGHSEHYDESSRLTLLIRRMYSDPDEFVYLKQARQSGQVHDSLLARQLEVLYRAYLRNQMEPDLLKQIVELSTQIEKNFSTFRGTIDGQTVTSNQIKEVLKLETDSAKRKKAWLASKQVGPVVAADLIRLVKLRNRVARELGFDNYHTFALEMGEQSVEELDAIFDELYTLTNKPFAKLKAELDGILAKRYGLAPNQLMPWHYHDPFFQETPMVYELDLDAYYVDKDIKELAAEFYDGIGLPVESILANSDLYEKEGKNPHAFCTDIDREGDVRILCNIKNNETWMEVTLHELGHAVYDKYQDPKVPYLLREPAHAFTTEAVAMFFGRLSRNPAWMQQMLGLPDEQRAQIERTAAKYTQLKQLIFARWAMVMYQFEKQLYANPDQDLNALWWKTVHKYQDVAIPADRDEPDWAAKIHFAIAPCYYHNYMLGELLASQLHHHIIHRVPGLASDEHVSYVGRKKVGKYLARNVFEAGDVYHWNEMIRRATGEPLTAKYFVEQFVR